MQPIVTVEKIVDIRVTIAYDDEGNDGLQVPSTRESTGPIEDAKGSDRRLMAYPVPSRESDHEGSMEAHNIGLAI